MTLDLINFVPNTKIKASEVNTNFSLLNNDLSITQGTVEQLNDTVANGCVPVGAVFWFARQTVPDGYLVCNGNAYPKAAPYDTLYTAIGTTYGVDESNPTTTFRVPKLTDGRFIKGTTQNSVGGSQNAAVGGHTHTYSGTTATANKHSHSTNSYSGRNSGYGPYPTQGSVIDAINSSSTNTGEVAAHSHTYSGTTANNATGVENVPKNIALLPCIKY